MADPVYAATATAWGGREGKAASDDGKVDLQLSMPKAMGGDDGPGTNPEQLFATGYAACFHSALKLVARKQKVDVSDSAVSVTISVTPDDTSVALSADIHVQIDGLDADAAQALADAAHEVCPYSKATRGNIAQTVTVVRE